MLNLEKWVACTNVNVQNIEIKQITLYNSLLCPAVYYVIKQNTDTLAFNTCILYMYLFSSFGCRHAGVISCYAQRLMFNVQLWVGHGSSTPTVHVQCMVTRTVHVYLFLS